MLGLQLFGAAPAFADWDAPATGWERIQSQLPQVETVVQAAPVSALEARLNKLAGVAVKAPEGQTADMVRALAGLILRKGKAAPENLDQLAQRLEDGYAKVFVRVDEVLLVEADIAFERPIRTQPSLVNVQRFDSEYELLDKQGLAGGPFMIKSVKSREPMILVYAPRLPADRVPSLDEMYQRGAVVTHMTVVEALRAARRACEP
ncbi:MAG: hypothetical protein PHF00_08605 [Elusimicrobia bacterium]|nr:hypothetical protein [Elusimicrobiota bacterium]